MRLIATDGVAWSVGRSVCLSVCRFVTTVSPAKAAESIVIPSGMMTWVALRKHVLNRVQIPRR